MAKKSLKEIDDAFCTQILLESRVRILLKEGVALKVFDEKNRQSIITHEPVKAGQPQIQQVIIGTYKEYSAWGSLNDPSIEIKSGEYGFSVHCSDIEDYAVLNRGETEDAVLGGGLEGAVIGDYKIGRVLERS